MQLVNSSLRIGLQVLLWLVIWGVLIALPASSAFGTYFSYSQLVDISFSQCFLVNGVRGFLYLLLFAGNVLIVKKEVQRSGSANDSNAVTSLSAYVFMLVAWLCYWTTVSEMLYFFGASHFMLDCDANDMECACDNRPFLYPLYVLTSIFGCFIYTQMYRNRNKRSGI